MVEISLRKAKVLFAHGRAVYVLPDYVDKDDHSFNRLHLVKSRFMSRWPQGRLEEYRGVYCSTHSALKYYAVPIPVLIRRNGNVGFLIKNQDGGILHILRGSDQGLVQYLNQKLLRAINAGYLEPHFRNQLIY